MCSSAQASRRLTLLLHKHFVTQEDNKLFEEEIEDDTKGYGNR